MDISGSHRIAASRATVWAALHDPEILESCIPGCERVKRTEGGFEGVIASKVGPIRTTISGEAVVSDAAAPERFSITARGADPAAGGGEGSGVVTLSDADGGTLVAYRGAIEVEGKIGQLGQRLVSGVFRRTVEMFFENLSARLGAEATGEPAHAREPEIADAPPLAHEEPPEAPAAMMDAPPLAAGGPDWPKAATPIAPTAAPAIPDPVAIAASDAVEAQAGGASSATRIMLVAAVVVVIGAVVYYILWQAPGV